MMETEESNDYINQSIMKILPRFGSMQYAVSNKILGVAQIFSLSYLCPSNREQATPIAQPSSSGCIFIESKVQVLILVTFSDILSSHDVVHNAVF